MKEWYTAQELALQDLPDLPRTDRRIRARAERENWKSRSREFGKGLEYHLSSFPLDTQAALLKAEARQFLAENPLPLVIKPTPALPDPALKDAGDALAAHLSGKPLARMDAKINILQEFRRFVRATPVTGTQKPGGKLHKEAFAAAWNRGEIDSKAVAVIPRLAADKLDRWPRQLQRAGLAGLAGRYGNRRGHTLIDQQPQLAVALRSLLVETPHISHVHAHEFLCARYHGSDLRLPSLKTVARWITDWKAVNHSLFCKLSDPDRWKSTYQSAIGDASAAIIALNQEWQADSTPADLELADGRHNLIFLLDVYSRRLKIQVSKTSTAAAIAAVLRRGLLDWGVPETLKTDNGADYVSDHIRRICHTLDIQHHLCAPFTPEGKGHVERHVQTFSHDLLELLPGYIGHNVAERQALRARQQFSDRMGVKGSVVKLAHSAADLQAFCDRWCDAYHDRPHRGLHTQTPNQVVASWHKRGNPIRRIADDRILDILLAPAPSGDGWRVVGKGDHIKVDGFGYNATALALHVGDRVRVMYDETDMGKVYVFDGFGRFLAIAECPEVAGLDRRQIAMDSKTAQRIGTNRLVKAAKTESRKTLKGPAMVETALDYRAELAKEILPSPAGERGVGEEGGFIEHATPHIEGAAQALTGQDELSGGGFTPQQARAMGWLDDIPVLPLNLGNDTAPVIALPSPQRRSYSSYPERIRDVFDRHLLQGIAPDQDDLDILREFYGDYTAITAAQRLDKSVQQRHPHADITALKKGWLAAATTPETPTPETAARSTA